MAYALTSEGAPDPALGGIQGQLVATPRFGEVATCCEDRLAPLTGGTSGQGGLVATSRPDGSIVIAAPVEDYIASSSRGLIDAWDFAALTGSLTTDDAFGGPQQGVFSVAPAPNVRAPAPAASRNAPRPPSCQIPGTIANTPGSAGLHLLVMASQFAGVDMFVSAGGRRIAQGTALVAPGPANSACAHITAVNAPALTSNPALAITIRLVAEDLVGNRTSITTSAAIPGSR